MSAIEATKNVEVAAVATTEPVVVAEVAAAATVAPAVEAVEEAAAPVVEAAEKKEEEKKEEETKTPEGEKKEETAEEKKEEEKKDEKTEAEKEEDKAVDEMEKELTQTAAAGVQKQDTDECMSEDEDESVPLPGLPTAPKTWRAQKKNEIRGCLHRLDNLERDARLARKDYEQMISYAVDQQKTEKEEAKKEEEVAAAAENEEKKEDETSEKKEEDASAEKKDDDSETSDNTKKVVRMATQDQIAYKADLDSRRDQRKALRLKIRASMRQLYHCSKYFQELRWCPADFEPEATESKALIECAKARKELSESIRTTMKELSESEKNVMEQRRLVLEREATPAEMQRRADRAVLKNSIRTALQNANQKDKVFQDKKTKYLSRKRTSMALTRTMTKDELQSLVEEKDGVKAKEAERKGAREEFKEKVEEVIQSLKDTENSVQQVIEEYQSCMNMIAESVAKEETISKEALRLEVSFTSGLVEKVCELKGEEVTPEILAMIAEAKKQQEATEEMQKTIDAEKTRRKSLRDTYTENIRKSLNNLQRAKSSLELILPEAKPLPEKTEEKKVEEKSADRKSVKSTTSKSAKKAKKDKKKAKKAKGGLFSFFRCFAA